MFRRSEKRQEEYTSNGGEKYGLIILGNSGVGKSFLANVLVGREAFAHAFSSSAVTHETEFIEVHIGGLPLAIFNIPGLIEAEQERINLNKVEIDKAFSQRPNAVILFVFGHQNGRIRDEDVVAFNAINAAYPFRPESLVIVVNALPKDRPQDYEGTTFVLLQKLLPNTKVTNGNVCFLDSINVNNAREKQYLKEQLLKVVVEFTPKRHEKVQEINTVMDELKNWKKAVKTQQASFEKERETFRQQIEANQRALNEANTKHQSETQSLRRALEKQEQMFSEQKEELEEQRRQHQAQLDALMNEVKDARENYQRLNDDRAASQQAIREAQEKYESLARQLAEQKSGSDCTIL